MARAFAGAAACERAGKRQNLPSGRKGCRARLPANLIKLLNLLIFLFSTGWPAGCRQVTAPAIAEVPPCRVQRRTSVSRPQSHLRHGRRRRRRPKTAPKTTAKPIVAAPLQPCPTPHPPPTPPIPNPAPNRPPNATPPRPTNPPRK